MKSQQACQGKSHEERPASCRHARPESRPCGPPVVDQEQAEEWAGDLIRIRSEVRFALYESDLALAEIAADLEAVAAGRIAAEAVLNPGLPPEQAGSELVQVRAALWALRRLLKTNARPRRRKPGCSRSASAASRDRKLRSIVTVNLESLDFKHAWHVALVKRLARRAEEFVGRPAVLARLAGEPPPHLAVRIRHLTDLLAKHDELIHRLVEGHMPLVKEIVRQLSPSTSGRSDLIQEGSLGLLAATHRYRLIRGVNFSTFAFRCIHRSVRRAIGRWRRGSPPRESGDGTSVDRLVDLRLPSPESKAMAREMARGVRSLVASLDEPERTIVASRFGTAGQPRRTRRQLCDEHQFDPDQLRRAYAKALAGLQKKSVCQALEGFLE
jgi:RNA polymerase sigma factor (sigma-70 family)